MSPAFYNPWSETSNAMPGAMELDNEPTIEHNQVIVDLDVDMGSDVDPEHNVSIRTDI